MSRGGVSSVIVYNPSPKRRVTIDRLIGPVFPPFPGFYGPTPTPFSLYT